MNKLLGYKTGVLGRELENPGRQGPKRSNNFWKHFVPVRIGPRIFENNWSWSKSVLGFPQSPGPKNDPKIPPTYYRREANFWRAFLLKSFEVVSSVKNLVVEVKIFWSLFLRWILVEELILFSQDITQQEIAQRERLWKCDWLVLELLLPTDPNLQSWLFIRHPRNDTFDNYFPRTTIPQFCVRPRNKNTVGVQYWSTLRLLRKHVTW